MARAPPLPSEARPGRDRSEPRRRTEMRARAAAGAHDQRRGRRQTADETDVITDRVLVVLQVVPEELAENQPGGVLVQGVDPRRAVEADHALPHVLLDDAEQLLRQDRRADVAG